MYFLQNKFLSQKQGTVTETLFCDRNKLKSQKQASVRKNLPEEEKITL